jgi:hypothetical protein
LLRKQPLFLATTTLACFSDSSRVFRTLSRHSPFPYNRSPIQTPHHVRSLPQSIAPEQRPADPPLTCSLLCFFFSLLTLCGTLVGTAQTIVLVVTTEARPSAGAFKLPRGRSLVRKRRTGSTARWDEDLSKLDQGRTRECLVMVSVLSELLQSSFDREARPHQRRLHDPFFSSPAHGPPS